MSKGKNWFLALAAIIVVAGAIAYITSVYSNPEGRSTAESEEFRVDPEFSGYINSFTSGFIASNSTIRIRLNNPPAESVELNAPVKEKYFVFEPSIEGTTVWSDAQTLEFVPDRPLAGGQEYKGTFHLSKLVEVKDQLKDFEFRFQTIAQSVQLLSDDLKSYNSDDFRYYSLNGSVNTADVADKKLLENTLVATLGSRSLSIKWAHDEGGTVHRFLIDSIERSAHDNTLTVTCDGTPLHVSGSTSRTFEVPREGKFLLFNTRVVGGNEPFIVVNFSNPLHQSRSLEGLVALKGLNEVKYIVNENQVLVYPTHAKTGAYTLRIDEGVTDANGQRLGRTSEHSVVFSEAEPGVRFIGNGNILPSTQGLSLPFETVNLKAVDVTIVKIYENNVLQFLQNNTMDGSYQLTQVGKKVVSKRILLGLNNPAEYNNWKKFSLDMSTLFKAERGAIYRVSLSFKKSYSTYACLGNTFGEKFEMEEIKQEEEAETGFYNSYNDYEYEDYGYDEGYNWQERNDPCKDSYYMRSDRAVTKNILASDVGLTLKKGNDGSLLLIANDLVSSRPLSGVEVSFYDYQKQVLEKGKTDGEGQLSITPARAPSFVVAKWDNQFAYLRLEEGATLPLSLYDVSGAAVKKGVKGFIYAERGVWRPGDSLFLNFILEDKLGTLPENHPVVFTLLNPQGQVYKRLTSGSSVNGFYNFTTVTDQEAPTGVWTAEVKVGPVKFTRNVRIESIMPNRLKINLDFGKDEVLVGTKQNTIGLHTSWLTGAIAKNLDVKMNLSLTSKRTEFPKFRSYVFDNGTASFESENIELFGGKVDGEGKATIPLKIEAKSSAPGLLKATFNTMVFEPGGAFSVDRFTMDYSPYSHYAGIRVPSGERGSGILYTGKEHKIDIATVDAKGNPVSRPNMKFEIYKMEWRWWWDQYENELANYASDDYHQPFQSQVFSTSGGKGTVTVKIDDHNWGRYLLRVIDVESGHAATSVVYFDWANWMERDGEGADNRIVANMLSFTTDKERYSTNEEVKVTIPSPRNGRALITIENGSRVIEAHWLETKETATIFKFKVTPQMAPNVYVHVTLLQPHSRTNDLPIRLYGVVPVTVDDKETHLKPVIKMADVLEPEKRTSITVFEENNREMAFTIAVVDEGLLDLTRFKTPDPHPVFYAKEALGVKTWDVYDQVIGAYGTDLERVLSIGGDDGEMNSGEEKANRFKPMVRFFGPYFLEKGDKTTISFKMPMYVGSVRTMVIAGDKGAYGIAEKTTPVQAPLMILGTLPRVLSVGEEVRLPVSVFGGRKTVGRTEVKVEVNELLGKVSSGAKTLNVGANEEGLVYFDLRAGDLAGVAKVSIIATGGGHTAKYEMDLDIRNPNPYETITQSYFIEPGKSLEQVYKAAGVPGTNTGVLEISSIPSINLDERINYLIRYPHGCIEQTTSQVFAQLHLPSIMELSSQMKTDVETNIKGGLNELRKFQVSGGGFSYWPGENEASDWGTSYAGHFFLSAEKMGYALPPNMKKNWISYQQNKTQQFEAGQNRHGSYDQLQAYRLYVLSLANSPVMGAMNRLREVKSLSNQAKWLLAAAYAQSGQLDEAEKLITTASTKMPDYLVDYYTYGSSERDMAIVLQTYCLMDKKSLAFNQLKKVAGYLSADRWLSTQTTAYGLVAVADFVRKFGGSSAMQGRCYVNGKEASLENGSVITQVPLTFSGGQGGKFEVRNQGKGVLFVNTICRGQPAIGTETAANENISASISYKDLGGKPVDVSEIEQGSNFIVSVAVKNLGAQGTLRNIAVTNNMPSGWEIHNARMNENEGAMKSSSFTYQDIRDDKVLTYFDLAPNETKTINVMVNATYEGKYYLPGLNVEAMYDNTVFARTKGQWIRIVKGGGGVAGK